MSPRNIIRKSLNASTFIVIPLIFANHPLDFSNDQLQVGWVHDLHQQSYHGLLVGDGYQVSPQGDWGEAVLEDILRQLVDLLMLWCHPMGCIDVRELS